MPVEVRHVHLCNVRANNQYGVHAIYFPHREKEDYSDEITSADLKTLRASVRDEVDSTEWERADGPAW
jgi:hypothetical protein